ncbi:hypothetical protein Dsin_014195 [Dipteronia sinensis]|uniref:Uncharacterized protein n=1 Tax=Dipteronia sinensis TaxID=43782 RepID=A0AAE0EBC4_9ROSI|nr:hypothetical protein Dsin_014195 [Dipteronia sinensis]
MAPKKKQDKNKGKGKAGKGKGKGKASSSGGGGSDPNPDYTNRLYELLRRQIHSNWCIDLNDVRGSNIVTQMDAMGWRQFVTTGHHINERVVRKFYASMIPADFKERKPVGVRGVNILIRPKEINNYYGTTAHRRLRDGVPDLDIHVRYNTALAKDLCMNKDDNQV